MKNPNKKPIKNMHTTYTMCKLPFVDWHKDKVLVKEINMPCPRFDSQMSSLSQSKQDTSMKVIYTSFHWMSSVVTGFYNHWTASSSTSWRQCISNSFVNGHESIHNWRAPWKNWTSLYISFFSAHHSTVFYFQCSVYWWKECQILVF